MRWWWGLFAVVAVSSAMRAQTAAASLPDAPDFVAAANDAPSGQNGGQNGGRIPRNARPCNVTPQMVDDDPEAMSAEAVRSPCVDGEKPYQQFLNSPAPLPLTPRQKGILAVRDVTDPFNLITLTLNAGFTVAIDAHTGYGPGLKGFGKDIGYSFVQDATGEFIGTFMICSLLSQDPHYHREPEARPLQRLGHAIKHTYISQHDDGRPMLNYENFITYPASAEIANLYVPGIHGNGPSTVTRFLTGLATDPVNNIITEFLPDFARRFHVRIIFVQQILNQISATGQL